MSAFLVKYAAATTLYFPLISYNSVSFSSTASLTTADSKISKNGAAFATTSNAVASIGSYGYKLTLTTGDTTCLRGMIVLHHTAAAPAFEDSMLLFDTYGNASAQHIFDLSVANQTVIASAGTVTIGASGLSAGAVVAGAFSAGAFAAGFISAGGFAAAAISAGAIAASAISSGAFVSGAVTASGNFPTNFSALTISAGGLVSISTGALVNCGTVSTTVVTSVWAQAMVEPTGVPVITASMVSGLSWMFALSKHTITQSSVLQSVYKSDGTTLVAAATIGDDGTLFTRGSFN